MKRTVLALVAVGIVALAAACGSDDKAATTTAAATSAAPTTAAATTAAATTTKAPTTTAAATTTTAPTTTAAATTTKAPTTTAAGSTTTAASGPAFGDPDQQAAATAFALVYDSAVPFEEKAPHLAEADALKTTIEAYATAGGAMGGISLKPTAVTVTGDTATVTYDVMFGPAPAYQDLTGPITKLADGTWQIARVDFCSFMAQARTPCPS